MDGEEEEGGGALEEEPFVVVVVAVVVEPLGGRVDRLVGSRADDIVKGIYSLLNECVLME